MENTSPVNKNIPLEAEWNASSGRSTNPEGALYTACTATESALRESEARYRLLYETANDGILLMDGAVIIDCNRRAAEIFGLPKEQIVGSTPDLFSPPGQPDGSSSREAAMAKIGLAMEGEPQYFEWRHCRPDGTPVDVEVSLNRVCLRGKFLLQAIIRDITARKKTDAFLKAQLKILSLLAEWSNYRQALQLILPEILAFTGAEAGAFRLIDGDDCTYFAVNGFPEAFVNSEFSICAAYDRGRPLPDAGDRLLLECFCGMVIRGETDLGRELFSEYGSFFCADLSRWLAREGPPLMASERRTWRLRCLREGYETVALVPIKAGQETIGLIQLADKRPGAFSRDCLLFLETVARPIGYALRHRQAQEALEKSEERLRLITDHTTDLICQTDSAGVIQYASPSHARVLGYRPEEILGKAVFEFIHPEDLPLALKAQQEALQNRTLLGTATYRFRHARGHYVWMETAGNLILDRRGEVAGAVFGSRDVTERKQMEEELQYRVRFENLLNSLSTTFIKLGAGEVDAGIDRALAQIGSFVGADRSYLFQISDDRSTISNTHEWCAPGVSPQIKNLQQLPVNQYAWWMEQLERSGHVYIADVRAMPPELEAMQRHLQAQDIQSVVTVPMLHGGLLAGFLGFDQVREVKEWTVENIMLLNIAGEMFANALARQRAERALRESEARNRSFMMAIPDMVFRVSREGVYLDAEVKDAGYLHPGSRFHFERDALINKNIAEVLPPALAEKIRGAIGRALESRSLQVLEYSFQSDRGTRYSEARFVASGPDEVIAIVRDITERKEMEVKLKYLSFHDALTGLYNRAFFEEELHRLGRSREYPFTVIAVDLDGLKLINDTIGHKKGDELLKACAAALKKPLRRSDILARTGGDEFAIILPRTAGEAGERVAGRIQEAVRKHNRKHPHLPLSVSLGVATGASPADSLESIYKKADALMYRDKLYRSASTRGQIVSALLATLAERDYIAQGHAARLQDLCRRLGERVGLSSRQHSDLALLAQVHDLGKVGVPDRILFKKGPLTQKEWEIMKSHSEKGYRIARSSPDLADVADLILRHHEQWDGAGYPLGLAGEEIPIECRILALADAYDAMTNGRPYRAKLTPQEAAAEIARCAGSQFEPGLANLFLEMLDHDQTHMHHLP